MNVLERLTDRVVTNDKFSTREKEVLLSALEFITKFLSDSKDKDKDKVQDFIDSLKDDDSLQDKVYTTIIFPSYKEQDIFTEWFLNSSGEQSYFECDTETTHTVYNPEHQTITVV